MEDFAKVIASGKRRESLEAMRDLLANRLVDAGDRESAGIAKELRAIVDAIDAIPTAREESVVDNLADEVAVQRDKRKRDGRGKDAAGL